MRKHSLPRHGRAERVISDHRLWVCNAPRHSYVDAGHGCPWAVLNKRPCQNSSEGGIMSKPFADLMKMSDAELDAAKQWRMHDAGIGAFAWFNFRCEVGKLSVREKLRPTHWQRDLGWFFMGHVAVAGLPQDEKQERLITRVITAMMNESRVWCNPQIGVDEPAAALRCGRRSTRFWQHKIQSTPACSRRITGSYPRRLICKNRQPSL